MGFKKIGLCIMVSAFCFLVSIYLLFMLKREPEWKSVILATIILCVILGIVFAVLAGKSKFANISEEKKNKM